jgi:hypothetical protein
MVTRCPPLDLVGILWAALLLTVSEVVIRLGIAEALTAVSVVLPGFSSFEIVLLRFGSIGLVFELL